VSGAHRRAEFFVLEATEYLAELEQLVASVDSPDLERMVRGARALRGAALMAGLGTFARASAALEGLARQVRDHALGWEPDARAGWREGIQTLRGLVSRAGGWEAADDRHALLLADRVERITKGETGPTAPTAQPGAATAPAATGLTPGVRAFIARESALIAGSLQEAARALAPMEPPLALGGVLERLRSLRGLGGSVELTPLPELLDAMEVTTRCLLRTEPAPPDVAAVFADAADALASMAQSIADQGRVTVPAGLDRIARRLLDGFASQTDVVSITSLAPAGEPSIVRQGNRPTPAAVGDPVPIELVGVGDHLLHQADALATGRSPAARDLRLFVLHQTLTTMPATSRTGHFLAPLSRAIARTIGSGRAHADPDAFGTLLRDCGQFLVDHGGDNSLTDLVARRDAFATALGDDDAEPMTVPVPVSDATELESAAILPIAALAPDDAERDEAAILPIAALSPDDTEPDEAAIVPIAALAPDDAERDEAAIVPIASLAPDDTERDEAAIVSIAALAPDAPSRLERAYRRLAELESRTSLPTADITTLLYRGERALIRADEIRAELAGLLSGTSVDLMLLRPLVEELLDLVPLARDAA
jgi:chemotaxis protein histidine kinase CheA